MANSLMRLKGEYDPSYGLYRTRAEMKASNIASGMGALPKSAEDRVLNYDKYIQHLSEFFAQSLRPTYQRINQREIQLSSEFMPNKSMSPVAIKGSLQRMEQSVGDMLISRKAILDGRADLATTPDRYFEQKQSEFEAGLTGTPDAHKNAIIQAKRYFAIPDQLGEWPK